ncbi:hypothetical protein [Dyella amyloliquefaciens]|uniref:hypothetical protein n=1 Tax=Dyella amyloliquefaciens TaxID=1770545 RepID=UPI00102EAF45|nr:hypothetical protein [Dyella amyloliquefaciens]
MFDPLRNAAARSEVQRVVRSDGRRTFPVGAAHLPLLDHMHHLDAATQDPGTLDAFGAQRGSRSSLAGAVILLDQVVQILLLSNVDRLIAGGGDVFERSEVRSALIYRHRLGYAILGDPIEVLISTRVFAWLATPDSQQNFVGWLLSAEVVACATNHCERRNKCVLTDTRANYDRAEKL